MAVLMSPTEHANLWNSEVKSHRLGNFKCRCFVMADVWPSCDTLWRLRPELSLSVRLPGKQYRKIEGRNSWMRFHAKRSSAYTLGSRMEDSYLPLRAFVLPPARDIDKILKCFKSDHLVSNQLLSDLTVKSELYTKDMNTAICKGSDFNTTFSETYQPVEEPWFPKSSLLSSYGPQSNSCTRLTDEERIPHHDKSDSSEAKSFKVQAYSQIINTLSSIRRRYDPSSNFSERDQPVEEPWLFESSLFLSSNTKVDSVKKTVKDKATLCENNNQHQLVTEILMPEVESKTNAHEDSVPKVILINSSVCTMQRIAVLEDGKLVELFLEPVKSNVRCDSVYLGVVTKLVPHMGGAFVDIGSHRSSLMGIKKNREPFIFPPFGRSKEQEVNGSAFVMPEEHPGADEIQNDSDDVEAADEVDEGVIDDDSVQFLHDDDVDRDLEDDYDIQEVLKVDNGSLPGHGEVEAAVDGCSDMLDLDGNMHNMKGCSDNAPASQLQDKQKVLKDACPDKNKWGQVKKGTKIIVQVVKEGLGTKSPTLTAYPKLKSRFWVLTTRCNKIGISKKICGLERLRLRDIAAKLQPEGFGLIVRTVAAGHSRVELLKDLQGLLSTWKDITEHAKSAALAADEGVEGAAPVMLHSAMGQTLSVVQDYFSEKVKSLVVDSPRTYHEVTNYLQKIAPDLCDRVELYNKRTPLFDAYDIEEEMSSILSKRVPLSNGGYLVIEQTEALVSIDVNGGQVMLRQGTSQEKAVLNVNLAAAKQIARELRLRDIGGIIVVDFIDMEDDANKRLVYEEVKKAVERDRSSVKVSELSRHGLMEIIRKRVRPSVMFMISEPCSCCHATGRVEALETSFSKIEREICRLLATMNLKADPEKPKSWPRFVLWVDNHMSSYLTSGRRTRLAVLSSYLKVWIFLKVARGFSRGTFEVKPFTDEKDQNIQLHQVAISMLRRAEVGSHTPGRKVRVIPSKKSKSRRK